MTPRPRHLFAVSLAIAVLILSAVPALAATPLACDVQTATECQISTLHDLGPGGTFTVDRTLHILGAPAEIRTSAGSTLVLNITGGLVIDTGGKITGNASGGNLDGANITITTTGTVLLSGNGTSGAAITADQVAGTCTGGGGGSITIQSAAVSDSITIQSGAIVSVNAVCSAGAIALLAPNGSIQIAGLVQSKSTLRGTGANQPPGGGPITVNAGCSLTIDDTGVVSSRGLDPGADLVHLQGGCKVVIQGLVESTGPGHVVPNNPKNHCNNANRPDKPSNSTACVEVWAGDSLLIDATGNHRGEINADTAQSGGHQIAWIDLFSRGPITITGNGTGPYAAGATPYAVHANEFVGNSQGGFVTVISTINGVTATGRAIQAEGGLNTTIFVPTRGGQGGKIVVEGGGTGAAGGKNIDFAASSIRARGATTGGGPKGGTIFARSFRGNVLGVLPGELNAGGGGVLGSVTLQACTGVAYTGTSTPPLSTLPNDCTGAPTLPAYVTLPNCVCGSVAPNGHIIVTKVTCPADDPTQFSITALGVGDVKNGPATRLLSTVTTVDYEVTPGTWSVSEAAQLGWAQTGNTCDNLVVLENQTVNCTITNTQPACVPEFCTQSALVAATLDPQTGRFPGNQGPDVVVDVRSQSLQDALDTVTDINGDGYVIIGVVAQDNGVPGGQGNQEIQINRLYDKPFALIGCSVTLRDPAHCDGIAPVQVTAGAGSPEFPTGSGVTLFIQGFTTDNSDSAPGWVIEGNGRFLNNVASQGNLLGLQITGDGNTMVGGFVKNNLGGGIVLQGNGNRIDGVQISSNLGGDGINATGNSNQLLNNVVGDAGVGNGANGILLTGKGNLVGNNKVFQNNLDGINVSGGIAGSPNVIKGNISGSGQHGGNGGNGIVLGGTGNGTSSPIELEANTTQSNSLDGIRVTGTGHQLKDNVSGGFGLKNNGTCEYNVAAGNFNATGNKVGSFALPGVNGSPFPTSCIGP
ncbi:MAG TPA: right-handed parallel beta-helix repeat-containing protein [Methylomirabilota bacterium]|jgi:hypothetical protein|nr:right-handed parallel beta-helix repeat-containing protein [Methylomirabilota bacterium]